MNIEILAYLAGTISSFIFVGSNVPMVWKVFKTKDMRSYSILNLALVNTGNLIYWLYIVSLPMGPIWLLHTFYTLVSVLMLVLYLVFHVRKININRKGRSHDFTRKVKNVVLAHYPGGGVFSIQNWKEFWLLPGRDRTLFCPYRFSKCHG